VTKEEAFANEFLSNNGLTELVDVINTANGNTLAVGAYLMS
jgi:hypothetical protein